MKPTINVENCLEILRSKLVRVSETASLDAQVLLAHFMNRPRSWIMAHPEASVDCDTLSLVEASLDRIGSGEPLPYLLGHWEFYGLDFLVNPSTLIPRPETELLVEKGLKWLEEHPSGQRVIDVGTGSGCIAISLATHCPDQGYFACDLSQASLSVAQMNAKKHGVDHAIHFFRGDLLNGTAPGFNLVCANLPYIPSQDLDSLFEASHEPKIALDGGADGLAIIRRLVASLPRYLAPGGLFLCEIEARQGSLALNLGRETFKEAEINLFQDLSHQDRLLSIQLQETP
jgi:release factor glutamine methyltransferase